MKNLMTSIFVLFYLTSCKSFVDVKEVPQLKSKPSSEAMTYCQNLMDLTKKDFESVVLKLDEVSTLYYECQSKQKELKNFILNQKD